MLIGVGGSLATVGAVDYYAGDLPSLDSLNEAGLPQASRIYDRNGTLIDVLYHENRTVVPLAKISPLLRQATMATEDRTFYSNRGVDWRRLAIAGLYDVSHRSSAQGGSTWRVSGLNTKVQQRPVSSTARTTRRGSNSTVQWWPSAARWR